MKIFISSVIGGFESFRHAASVAAADLGHSIIRAEDFVAGDMSSRNACLEGIRAADLVVLLLGARYGMRQSPLNIAPTHEEFLEARGTKPILVFVQDGVERESEQAKFIELVESWDEGRHRRTFSDSGQLRSEVTRAIHEFQLRSAGLPVDVAGLQQEAAQLVNSKEDAWSRSAASTIHLGFAFGPPSLVLRPRELEAKELEEKFEKELLYGPHAIFQRKAGTEVARRGGIIQFSQRDGRSLALSEQGSVSIRAPTPSDGSGILTIVVEEVENLIKRCIMQTADIMDYVDDVGRLSRVVIAARLTGADYMSWVTRAEAAFTSKSRSISLFGDRAARPVFLTPPDKPRASLRYETQELGQDLTALLQRAASGQGEGF